MRDEGLQAYLKNPHKVAALVKLCVNVLESQDIDLADRDIIKLLSETCMPYGDDLAVLDRCTEQLKNFFRTMRLVRKRHKRATFC